MKESYLTKAFRKTAHERFPEQEAVLNSAFEKRLGELRSEHAGAGKERLRHLESQILSGIASYETLQTVMPKEEAIQTVHDYADITHNNSSNPRTGQATDVGVTAMGGLKANLTVHSRCFFIFLISFLSIRT